MHTKQTKPKQEYIYSCGKKIPLEVLHTQQSFLRAGGACRGKGRYEQRLSRRNRSSRLSRYGFMRIKKFLWYARQTNLWDLWSNLTLRQAWQYSLLSALVLGVAGTSFVHHEFGQSVFADENNTDIVVVYEKSGDESRVLGLTSEETHQIQFEDHVRELVKGYPIEDMLPYILRYDQKTAAFLVSIARKESVWGKRVPVYYGENCFNYWGYRGQDEIMGSAGHTCFDTPKEAVITVANRLQKLIDGGRATARDLIVWKCGYSCEGHSSYSVEKWISDVDSYYRAIMNEE